MISLPAQGLYAITRQVHPDLGLLETDVRAALAGGAAVIQFRDKSGDGRWRREAAKRVQRLCREAGVPLIINDDIALAGEVGAAGVHLGRDDADLFRARGAVAKRLLLGASCYDDLDRAAAAARAGADYLAFGSVYPSGTKPDAVHCGLDVLRQARNLGCPVVAIGGITPENGAPVIEAGADFLAVIDGVFGADDIEGAARQFAALWSS